MSSSATPPRPGQAERLAEMERLFAACVDRLVAGETLDLAEICRHHPETGPLVVEQLRAFQAMVPIDDDESTSIDEPVPERIGRYRISHCLGRGGFGRVFLAFDDQLRRSVAVKVPHPDLVADTCDAELYLAEARTLAKLDHPHIVPVHDVGSTDELPCYFVSKYIDGESLDTRLRRERPAFRETARLVALVADALQHAHKNGLVHRDIKPSNILLDAEDRPHVVDFGIALNEVSVGRKRRFVGTPAYMSPEQARGEGHRVDGRSDIFSLGVILYELLTGRRPFRGDSAVELFGMVAVSEPKPPRQFDETIPKEIERICLKAMAHRASDRYTTAHDMAMDLFDFCSRDHLSMQPASPAYPTPARCSMREASTHEDRTGAVDWKHASTAEVIPKGLRSFDAHDRDFFLTLLPGPRDRNGLPENIRFWKHAVEDSDEPFSVGLIYGPSGCGKSSIVKAGLIPRLSPDTETVYVEASAFDTETRLLVRLRRRYPALSDRLDLAATLACLRQDPDLRGSCRKILLVVDQFEQWLHANQGATNHLLVRALRQCDGEHLQAILLVRDDFWMAVTRFMRELDVRLVEGWNANSIDLFPSAHAAKVLTIFGRSNGDLPESCVGLSPVAADFVTRSVSELANDGKVVPVRLALFSEVMKGREWTPATLDSMGGMEGIGAAFLEKVFGAETGSPAHRAHERAARRVLQLLLPPHGIDIKGHRRARSQLMGASGYTRAHAFNELMDILDRQLRLISPTEAHDHSERADEIVKDAPMCAADPSKSAEAYYQLTHDYLVPSLREWLTRKQRETSKGRAALLLAELSATWNTVKQNRYLPTRWEFIKIHAFTHHGDWNEAERTMMKKANRVYGARVVRASVCAVAIVLFAFVFRQKVYQRVDIRNAETLVAALVSAPAESVLDGIDKLRPFQTHAVTRLRKICDEPQYTEHDRIVAAIGLAHFGEVRHDLLAQAVLMTSGESSRNLLMALRQDVPGAIDQLQTAFEVTDDVATRAKLATYLLQLGHEHPASQMLAQVAPDPTERIAFITGFSSCFVDGQAGHALLANEDPYVRSGACCALAELPWERRQGLDLRKVQADLIQLANRDPDPGTHAAARLVLRRWGIQLPESVGESVDRSADRSALTRQLIDTIKQIGEIEGSLVRARKEKEDAASIRDIEGIRNGLQDQLLQLQRRLSLVDRGWSTSSVGLTMIHLRQPDYVTNAHDGTWIAMSDAEISLGLFRQFVEETRYFEWPGYGEHSTLDEKLTPDHPVPGVNYVDAIRFCNWLSEREGLDPAYVEGEGVPSANGYRLPAASEWQFACRAMTDSMFSCGDDPAVLARFAVLGAERPWQCRSKLPNAWGFFDFHGNLWEWCEDLHTEVYPDGRLYRGGSYANVAAQLSSFMTNPMSEGRRTRGHGFRVARTIRPYSAFMNQLPTFDAQSKYLTFLENEARRDASLEAALVSARRSIAPRLVTYESIDTAWRCQALVQDHEAFRVNVLQPLLAMVEQEPQSERLVRYAEARALELDGHYQTAWGIYHALIQSDPECPEPLLQAIACLRNFNPSEAVLLARDALRWFPSDSRFQTEFIASLFVEAASSDEDVDAKMAALVSSEQGQETWQTIQGVVDGLRERGWFCINCGTLHAAQGQESLWGCDRYFQGGRTESLGTQVAGSDGNHTYQSSRSFEPGLGGSYRVPLPVGRYRVTLYITEGWFHEVDERRYDVYLEGEAALSDFDPARAGFATAQQKEWEVEVKDGLLEIELRPILDRPHLNGIRIERIPSDPE